MAGIVEATGPTRQGFAHSGMCCPVLKAVGYVNGMLPSPANRRNQGNRLRFRSSEFVENELPGA
jgi:hypothetical protein